MGAVHVDEAVGVDCEERSASADRSEPFHEVFGIGHHGSETASSASSLPSRITFWR
jgi:hypothetical protein